MNGLDHEKEDSMSEERNIKTPSNGTNGNGEGVVPQISTRVDCFYYIC